MSNEPQIQQALTLVNQLIPLVSNAEKKLSSARNWGLFDTLGGGGFITDIIKHAKLSDASNSMDQVNYLMNQLQRTLQNISIPQDYRMQVGGFATFADFFFDSALVDAYMLSKIWNSLNEVKRLKNKLYDLKARLESFR